jgi:Tol biopolymer transport system component
MKPTITFLFALLLLTTTFATAAAFGGNTWFISQTEAGVGADAESSYPQTDGDGRYIVFQSRAENLVPNSGSDWDIFIKDRVTGIVTLASRGLLNQAPDGYSSHPYISEDGRYVAFSSYATNLVSTPLGSTQNVFVFDQQTGVIEHVSTNSEGQPGNEPSIAYGISGDGRYVLMTSDSTNFSATDTNEQGDVYVKDRQTGAIELISVGIGGVGANNGSYLPHFSTNGRYVAFTSLGTNLVPDDTNATWDIFWRDRDTQTTAIVSRATDNSQNQGYVTNAFVTDDGRYVGFIAEGNSLHPDALPGNDDNLIRHDMQTGANLLISADTEGNAVSISNGPQFSSDGRWVVFSGYDNILVPTDTNTENDVYLKEVETGVTEIVSVAEGGIPGDGSSQDATINRDGTVIVYSSAATNFAPNDDESLDIFAAVAFVETTAVTLDNLSVGTATPDGFVVAGVALLALLAIAGLVRRR